MHLRRRGSVPAGVGSSKTVRFPLTRPAFPAARSRLQPPVRRGRHEAARRGSLVLPGHSGAYIGTSLLRRYAAALAFSHERESVHLLVLLPARAGDNPYPLRPAGSGLAGWLCCRKNEHDSTQSRLDCAFSSQIPTMTNVCLQPHYRFAQASYVVCNYSAMILVE